MPLLLAPAKINLTLEVLSRRSDGFHGIRSVMVPVGLFDRITIEPEDAPSLWCDDARLQERNIVSRALWALESTPANVRIEKRIPVGGGLGGGSSDAATVLRAAMRAEIGCALRDADWLGIARGLGSDVPFFLAGTGALVEGTGERITPLGTMPAWWCIIAEPHIELSTAEIYRLLDDHRESAPAPTRARSESRSLRCATALQSGDFDAVCRTLSNDFHDIVLEAYPAVASARRALTKSGAAEAVLCGSGSCLFALFESEEAARRVLERIRDPSIRASYLAPFHAEPEWRT